MYAKVLCSLLVLLLGWGWVDDLYFTAAASEPLDATATSENDQYLGSTRAGGERQRADVPSVPATEGYPHVLTATAAGAALGRAAWLPLRVIASTHPLYAFMSLQR
jgi:hypothetical protein